MSTTLRDLVRNSLLKLSNTIYSPYAITIRNYIKNLESDLSASKKTEEKAVGDLGKAGLELKTIRKENDELGAYLASRTGERDVLKKQNDNLIKRNEDLRRRLDKAAQDRNDLREKVAELESITQPTSIELPKEVADALTKVLEKSSFRDDKAHMAWRVIQYYDEHTNGNLRTLQRYANQGNTIKLVDAIRYGYTVEKPEKTPDDHVFEQYIQFCDNGQYEAADGVLMAIEKLAPGKTDLVEKMRAVERLPF